MFTPLHMYGQEVLRLENGAELKIPRDSLSVLFLAYFRLVLINTLKTNVKGLDRDVHVVIEGYLKGHPNGKGFEFKQLTGNHLEALTRAIQYQIGFGKGANNLWKKSWKECRNPIVEGLLQAVLDPKYDSSIPQWNTS